ncbi:MAG: class I SAM-dependent methyltransferase [Patescibacteria group bacterium]|nr:class I SAM-dependent methyltransferase [Patescibacteria group bacterium]
MTENSQEVTGEITEARRHEVKSWMASYMGIQSLSQLVAMEIPWLKCSHILHGPFRSIMAKAHLPRRETQEGIPLQVNESEDGSICIVNPGENSGTRGVFQALSSFPDYLVSIPTNPERILQIGSVNYYSTVQLDRELAKLGITGAHLDVLDICTTIPTHLQFLLERGLINSANTIRPITGDTCTLPFNNGIYDIIYCDMVGPYLQDHSLMYREVHRVLRLGGTFIVRERHYDNHTEFVKRRNSQETQEQLVEFLLSIYPDESYLENILREQIANYFSNEWNFDAYWERSIDSYINCQIQSGFDIQCSIFVVPQADSYERISVTSLLTR